MFYFNGDLNLKNQLGSFFHFVIHVVNQPKIILFSLFLPLSILTVAGVTEPCTL